MDWNQRYVDQDTPWDRGESTPALVRLIEHLTQPATVLVPGCGRGHEVIDLAKQGFEAIAVDIAPLALKQLEDRLLAEDLEVRLEQDDLLTYTPPGPIDAVFEQTCLCALPPSSWSDYAACLARWLRPGGTLAASFAQTRKVDAPPYHCDLDQMKELFPAPLWSWHEQELRVPLVGEFYELAYLLIRN